MIIKRTISLILLMSIGLFSFSQNNSGNLEPNDSTAAPLAIEKIDLRASITEFNDILVSWTVFGDEYNFSYIFQRSSDNLLWETLEEGRVHKRAELESAHTNYDYAPLNGNNYYRIQLIDEAGLLHYSKTIVIENKNTAEQISKLYPNPASDQISLEILGNNKEEITVLSQSGQTMHCIPIIRNKNKANLQLNSLDPGIYFVKMGDSTKRFIKIR